MAFAVLTAQTVILPAQQEAPRFVLVHVRHGSAVLDFAGVRVPVIAPALLVLDDQTRPAISGTRQPGLDCLYFSPKLINSLFSAEQLRSEGFGTTLSGTDHQDFYLLHPFLRRHLTRDSSRIISLLPHSSERVAELMQAAARQAEAQNDSFWPCRTRSYLLELLFQLHVLAPDASQRSDSVAANDRMSRAMSFVHERYHVGFSLDELARAALSNRTTLNREFRAHTGMSVRGYTISLRMQIAATLLRETQVPLPEVMERVGYSNASHFARAFREHLGVPPQNYRRAHA